MYLRTKRTSRLADQLLIITRITDYLCIASVYFENTWFNLQDCFSSGTILNFEFGHSTVHEEYAGSVLRTEINLSSDRHEEKVAVSP